MSNEFDNLSLEDQQALGQTMHRLLSNPELRKTTLGLLKKSDPSVSLPEIELEEKLNEVAERQQEKISALESKLAQKELMEKREKQFASLREKGFDPVEVEKTMVEKRIADYETAAKYLELERSSAPPTPASITPIQLPDDAKAIVKNPRGWANHEAHLAINDLMQKRRKI